MKHKIAFVLILVAAVLTVSTLLLVPNLTLSDQGAIHFTASLNATTVAQGQAVRVSLQDRNTGDFKNSVPLADGLRSLNLSSGPCGGLYPGGIAVYEGAYGLDNISTAESLSFYPAGEFYDCPLISLANSFVFGPGQNLTTYFDLAGYYTPGFTPAGPGGSTPGVLHPFQPGAYTVIAGDPLGHAEVMHFRVTVPPNNLERSGPVSTFPASWLQPCSAGATGNLTTGVYLNLNSSSSLDHVNINQVYAQILNLSSFASKTVGHGWVVSEWTEIGPSQNSGTAGQVVASFILISGEAPSGYLYITYDLASGTVYTSGTAGTASCPG